MSLQAAVEELLRAGLPGLFGGSPSAVTLSVQRADATIETLPRTAADTEPRRTDALDMPAFAAGGPYTLSQAPAHGPWRIWLQSDSGRITLRDNEVVWDAEDPRRFRLILDGRDLTGVTGVGVRYSVIVVHTRLQVTQIIHIGLSDSDAEDLERAEALVFALLTLEQQRVAEASRAGYVDGDYGATVTTEAIDVLGATAHEGGRRLLEIRARLEITASRVLREGEGQPIERIRTPGRPPRPDHPVDILIDVDA